MKKLQCEGCGSSDFVKKDGLFECQYCGLKYSPEEISNLYKVKIDNSDKINNLLKLAKQARRNDNWEKSAQYYEMVLIENSENWEASFYAGFSGIIHLSGKKAPHIYSVISNALDTALPLIRDTVPDQTEQENAVLEIAQDIFDLTKRLSADIDTYDSANSMLYVINTMYITGNKIETVFPDDANYETLIADLWKFGVKMHLSILDYLADTKNAKNIIQSYSNKIKQYDENYQCPKFKPAFVTSLKKLFR